MSVLPELCAEAGVVGVSTRIKTKKRKYMLTQPTAIVQEVLLRTFQQERLR